MLVKTLLYGDVSENPMMEMFYPFFVGILAFVRTIEMFVKFFCHRTRMIRSSGSFLLFWCGRLGWVASSSHPIHKLNKASLKRNKFRYPDRWQALRTSLSRISATGELCMWLCLNGCNRCDSYQNMCLSRHRKSDLISFRSCIRILACLTHFGAQKPDRTPAVQSVHNLSRTEIGVQNTVATKPYVKMDHMSNQQKSEFVGEIFHIWSFWGGHDEILSKTYFIQEGMIC
jgi:hypothetical protein